MKTLTLLFTAILSLVSITFLTSCTKDQPDAYLALNQGLIAVDSTGTTPSTVILYANSDWIATTSSPWLGVSPISGTANITDKSEGSSIEIMAQPNKNSLPRVGIVRFISSGVTLSLTVVQSPIFTKETTIE